MPVYFSDIPSEWFELEGVYIGDIAQPPPATLSSNGRLTKIVADFPWGPTDEIVEMSGSSGLEPLIGQAEAPENYGGFRAITGKRWGAVHVVRVTDAGHQEGAIDIRDAGIFEVTTYDTSDDFKLEFSNIDGGGPYSVVAKSGDHAAEDDVYTELADKVANHSVLPDHIEVTADTQNDRLEITGSGNETWTATASVPTGGSGAVSWTSPTKQYTLTAEYPGAVGNEIEITHEQRNGGSDFVITVTWGNSVQTYGPFPYDGTAGTKEDINEVLEYVVFDWHNNYDGTNPLDRSNGVALKGGSDANLSDNTPYIDGIDVMASGQDGGVIMTPETPFVDAESGTNDETENNGIIARLATYANNKRALALVQAVADQSKTGAYGLDNNNAVANTYSDDNLFLFNHRVKQFIEGDLHTVDLAPFAASALANISEHISPAAYQSAREYYQPIRGYEDGIAPTRPDRVEAREAGANMAVQDNGGVWRLHYAVTADVGGDNELVSTKRMELFVGLNVAEASTPYQNEPPLPSNKAGVQSAINKRLELMEGDPAAPPTRMIEDFTNQLIDEGPTYVIFKQSVELWGEMGSIVNLQKVGERVQIEE
jgi:hypothetical protein